MAGFQRSLGDHQKSLASSVEAIQAKRDNLLQSWNDFKQAAVSRGNTLESAKSLEKFLHNAEEIEQWIDDKLKISMDESYKDPSNMQGKIKKHMAFEAEIMRNEDAINHLKTTGEEMIQNKHYAAERIAATIESILSQWEFLKLKTTEKKQRLNDALQLIGFRREADEVLTWISYKTNLASVDDIGKDLEHNEVLQKKFEDFINDIAANESRVDAINQTSIALISSGHPDLDDIKSKTQDINDAWTNLKKLSAARRQRLFNAHEIHTLNRDAGELAGRIAEKEAILQSEDLGRDLASVEGLLRKHEGFTRDLAALGDGVNSLAEEATRLATAYPESARQIKDRQVEVEESWHRLQTRSTARRQRLDDSLTLQRFLNDVRNHMVWLEGMRALISGDEPANDVAGAAALLQRHQEHKSELDARAEALDSVVAAGNALIVRGHYASADIQGRLDALKAERESLQQLLEQRRVQYEQSHELQLFLRDAEQVEGWIAGQEASLNTDELGDTLDGVEALLKRHDECEKSLAAQEEKMRVITDTATALVDKGHADAQLIRTRRDAVVARRAALNQLANTRRARLQESLTLQQFLRDAMEAETWITEKHQTASDASYMDPTNLPGKMQSHHSFEGELVANDGRMVSLRTSGQNLIQSGHYASDIIQKRLDQLGLQWEALRKLAADKGHKLTEALQHQQFQRRVEDFLEWCDEVDAALKVTDLGKDMSNVNSLLKKHQLLEAEIAGHKERIDAITAQAKQLVDAGHFRADAIKASHEALVARYAAFAAPVAARRAQLEASLALQKFFRDVDEELAWIAEKEPAATSQNFGRSLMAAQGLLKKHAALQAELAGRLSAIKSVQETANGLLKGNHYASDSVKARIEALMAKWDELNKAVAERKQGLEEALQTHQYFADANEAEAWMTEKQPVCTNDDYGKDEDSAQALLRKHEVVEADLRTFHATLKKLEGQSASCKNLRASGSDSLTSSPAKSNRPSIIATAAHTAVSGDELSVTAGETVTLLEKRGDQYLVQLGGASGLVPAAVFREPGARSTTPAGEAPTVADRQAALGGQYGGLLDAAKVRRTRLEESHKLHLLNREMDETEAWLDEREVIANATELGSDLEHNELLQAKFADFQKDLAATEARVTAANQLADQFLEQGHSQAPVIQQRKVKLNEHWARLQKEAVARAGNLARMHGVHKFNRDVDETKSRFAEKDAILSITDDGRDLAQVEALRRKHTAAIHDLAALESKVKDIRSEGATQAQINPECAADIKVKIGEIDTYWDALQAKAASRKQRLEDSLQLQQFINDHRDTMAWLSNTAGLAANDSLASDESGAEALLKQHQELRTSVDAHGDSIKELSERGRALQKRGHYASGEIGEKLSQLDAQLAALTQRIGVRGLQLEQCHELQLFIRQADQAESWISTREAPLLSNDMGGSLDGVETMLKKHADFSKSLAAQTEKINELVREADRLVAKRHYDAAAITGRKDATLARWNHLLDMANQRKARLGEALLVQQFHRDADEAEAWMAEKMATACDPSYRDPVNLQGKLQRHQAFSAEVQANEERILGVVSKGKGLMQQIPGEQAAISSRIGSLEEMWAALGTNSEDKARKLSEATQQQSYNHGVEDFEFWLMETEALLGNRDRGKDLGSVQSLLKKHAVVEADVAAHCDRMEAISSQAKAFKAGNHFDADSIVSKQEGALTRYRVLEDRVVERRAELEASLRLQQLYRDMDDEVAWMKEKERIAMSTDFGKDLTGVQNLQKKHQTFTAELSAHQARMDEVLRAAASLIADKHYAAADVDVRQKDLQRQWVKLLELSDARKVKLDETLAVQMFLADVDEEESWLNEKISMASSEDMPDTLARAQALLKKHEAFEADLVDHTERINTVCKNGQALIAKQNYQAAIIQQAITRLEKSQAKLREVAGVRKVALTDRCTSLQFRREADSILAWIADKEPLLASDDFGRDLPSVQTLLARQSSFESALVTFEARIAALVALKDELVLHSSGSVAAISQAEAAVAARWKKLQQASETRKTRLIEAQQLFQRVEDMFLEFAQRASQFNSWFDNAVEDLTDYVRVNSLDEIKTLRDDHAEFLRSLEGAYEKYDDLIALDRRIKSYTTAKNPYTWFSIESMVGMRQQIEAVIAERNQDIIKEAKRQEDNEALRKLFAKHANEFSAWLAQTRTTLIDGVGTLEAQLQATKDKHDEIVTKRSALKNIEDLGAKMEEALILDNKHTEHSTVSLAQQWDQLEQLAMRMQHNLEQQIQAKEMTGVSEQQLKEFTETFRYFDKDHSGKLDPQELKSCLRTLGYALPVVEEGQHDPEFEAILKQVDPNGDGFVSQSEFLSFMISRVTEKVESASEVVNAFRAVAGDKPYVTKEELYKALTREQADYCVKHMKPYVDSNGVAVVGGYDYRSYTQSLFAG